MRFRLFILFLVAAFTISQHALAQDVIVKRSSVIENYKGKAYYIHFVKQGETLSAISKAYNVSVQELIAENPLAEKGLKADMVLRIPQNSVVETPDIQNKDVVEQPKPIEKPLTQSKPEEKPIQQQKPAEDPNFILYQVKKQETLYGLSKQYNITVNEILAANPGVDVIKEGMWLKIPKKKPASGQVNAVQTEKAPKTTFIPDEIVVKQGETIYAIAKTYDVSYDELIDLNPKLSEGLKAGMILKLPKSQVKEAAKVETKHDTPQVVVPTVAGNCYNAGNIKTTYKIALLLPFLLDESVNAIEASEQKKPSDFENFNYFQFYAGFMLAADSLEKYGLHARIQVLDGDKLNDTLAVKQALRKPGMDKMDLIVGPMYANSFSVAARFAKKHEIGIINPLSRRENIVNGNPFVIKTQVSGSGIATKLVTFISTHYPDANIVSVRNDAKELKSTADEFESRIRSRITDHSIRCSLQTSIYSSDRIAGVSKKIKPNVKNIVIFFSNNKSSVPNFVSLLNPLSKSDDIILMGMDGWEDLDLETEFLVNLNYHQLTSGFVDYDSEAVQQFITSFRNKYGAVPVPSDFAFLGYDIGWYFLTSLMWYGNQYITCIPGQQGTGLQYNFNFAAGEKGNGLQNQNVTIIKLQDYKMVKVE